MLLNHCVSRTSISGDSNVFVMITAGPMICKLRNNKVSKQKIIITITHYLLLLVFWPLKSKLLTSTIDERGAQFSDLPSNTASDCAATARVENYWGGEINILIILSTEGEQKREGRVTRREYLSLSLSLYHTHTFCAIAICAIASKYCKNLCFYDRIFVLSFLVW